MESNKKQDVNKIRRRFLFEHFFDNELCTVCQKTRIEIQFVPDTTTRYYCDISERVN